MAVQQPLAKIWPLYRLAVRTPRLELRYPSDEELAVLATIPSEGIHEPGRQPFHVAWTEVPSPRREQQSLQWWWSQRASWSVDDWSLALAVVVDGEPVGVQDLMAKNFPVLRSVSTGSWLVQRAQGRGVGTEMRAAVVELAFRGLGALEARSSAFEWNSQSIRVSEKVGYVPNGEEFALRGTARERTLCFRLSRETWLTRRRNDIEITGLEGALALFGLGPDREPLD
jgi:RimJ/RimL family protein N-acetyltransferase